MTLALPLGRTIDGGVYEADLAALPHLLIGGAPGGGARCFLEVLVATLLRHSATDVGLLLVDPSGRAFRQFTEIPHLLAPVLTEPFHAAPALRWAVSEMKRRYRQLAAAGARRIDDYNAADITTAKRLADGRHCRRLCHVVIVLTELAAVMRYAKAEAEDCIFDLCCMARAVGIHLIVATEDLSPAVLSGMINVSLPARIAFRVSSRCDSRTMVFRQGAEDLRPGEALFLPPGSTTPVHLRYDSREDNVTS